MLADLARGAGDLLDRTATEAGALLKSKKGDFVLTVDTRVARGCDLKVVVEAKDRPMSMRAIREELREAKENRAAAVGLVVFTPAHAPAASPRSIVRGGDVYCVIDPIGPGTGDPRGGGPAGQAACDREPREREVEADAVVIATALNAIREQLEVVRTLQGAADADFTATSRRSGQGSTSCAGTS